MHWISRSPEETAAIAREFSRHVAGGQVVVLMGDLGAGKTTFTQAFAAAVGVAARVKSPTYTVLQEYAAAGARGVRRFVHMDLYRFTRSEELSALELEEYCTPDTIMMIEWPERVGLDALRPDWVVAVAHRGVTEREIRIDRQTEEH